MKMRWDEVQTKAVFHVEMVCSGDSSPRVTVTGVELSSDPSDFFVSFPFYSLSSISLKLHTGGSAIM